MVALRKPGALAQEVRRLRLQSGLGERAGLTCGAVSQIEAGRSLGSLRTVAALGGVLERALQRSGVAARLAELAAKDRAQRASDGPQSRPSGSAESTPVPQETQEEPASQHPAMTGEELAAECRKDPIFAALERALLVGGGSLRSQRPGRPVGGGEGD